MTEQEVIRVLIVDDHPVVRDGLKNMLLVFDDLQLVGQADSGGDALALCRLDPPDVVLMDVVMPGMNGVDTTRALTEQLPEIRVIILTSSTEDNLIQQALDAGATGYLLKNATIDEMADAIRAAHAGQPTLAPEATKALIRSRSKQRAPGHDLSPRELEVLALLAKGYSNSRIALELVISSATARHHVSACIQKLGVGNRTEAAMLAVEHNLIP